MAEEAATSEQVPGPEGPQEEDVPGDASGSSPLPYPGLAPVAFFCMRQTSGPRRWCLRLVCDPWFERASMLVILLNCATLGMFQPCAEGQCRAQRCSVLQAFDDFIFTFFAVEMILKMMALGIWGRAGYLGDTWNRLDFFIVLAGSSTSHSVSAPCPRPPHLVLPSSSPPRPPIVFPLLILSSPSSPHRSHPTSSSFSSTSSSCPPHLLPPRPPLFVLSHRPPEPRAPHLVSMLEYSLDMESVSLSAIRTIRVLRPLRAINRVPSMRILVTLLLDTLPMLGNVLLLCFFVFFIFGIVGVQLWAGLLRNRCFLREANATLDVDGSSLPLSPVFRTEDESDRPFICSLPRDNGVRSCRDLPRSRLAGGPCTSGGALGEAQRSSGARNGSGPQGPPGPYSPHSPYGHYSPYSPHGGHSAQAMVSIPENQSAAGRAICVDWSRYYSECRPGKRNPHGGSVNFDNIGYAWIAIFQVITLEGWVDIMYYVMDAHSFYNFIYFILLIIVGSFFMINLCLVVIATQFSETKQRENQLMHEQRARLGSRGSSIDSAGGYQEPGSCYQELLRYSARACRRLRRRALHLWGACSSACSSSRNSTSSSRPRSAMRGSCLERGGCLHVVKRRPRCSCRRHRSSSLLHHHYQQQSHRRRHVSHHHHHHRHHHHHHNHHHRRDGGAARGTLTGGGGGGGSRRRRTCKSVHHHMIHHHHHHHHHYHIGNGSGQQQQQQQSAAAAPGILQLEAGEAGAPLGPGGSSGALVVRGRGGRTASVHSVFHADCVRLDCPPTGTKQPLSSPTQHVVPPISYPTIIASGPPRNEDVAKAKAAPGRGGSIAPYRGLRRFSRTYSSSRRDSGRSRGSPSLLLERELQRCPHCPSDSSDCDCSDSDSGSDTGSGLGAEGPPDPRESRDLRRPSGHRDQDRPEEGSPRRVAGPPARARRWGPAGPRWARAWGTAGPRWARVSRWFRAIVESKYFTRGIMVAILINSLSMGIEYHEQPEELTNLLEISNMVFTSIFALEMLIKLLAFGLLGYIRNQYNIFDGIIVIISVCEIVGQSGGGLSVLRTFRLLRVLKLVRFMPALRRQLVVLMRTMDNVATFCMLLMLFIFIFSILGMHLFGCKFSVKTESGDTVPDRKNFDSLLWAIVTVFQILTQEDWNVVLYHGMASSSPWAALYFIALMTFGNYVLFNLLVAILVEGFQAEGDASRSDSDDDVGGSAIDEEGDPAKGLPVLASNGHADPKGVGGLAPTDAASTPSPVGEPWHHVVLDASACIVGEGISGGPGVLVGAAVLVAGPGPRAARRSSGSRGGAGSPRRQGERRSLLSPDDGDDHEFIDAPGTASGRDEGAGAKEGAREGAREGTREGAREGAREEARPPPSPPPPPTLLLPLASPPAVPGSAPHDLAAVRVALHRPALPLPLLMPVALHVSLPDCNGKTPPYGSAKHAPPDPLDDIDDRWWFRLGRRLQRYRPRCCVVRADWSLYVFHPHNRFRWVCRKIIAHKVFDHVVLLFIFLNCITIALERPDIPSYSAERVFLTVSNYIFTAAFVTEMAIKVTALGLALGDGAYLRSSWNLLDGLLVLVSAVDIVVSLASSGGARILGILRVLRLLRTLRPLRVISRAPGLKLVVETLITSLKPIGNIVLICCAFFIIFGILGVQLFKGKFYYCEGTDTRNITSRADCARAHYRWVRRKYNFDNLGQALMSLFVLASKDGWVNIMYDGLDAVGEDLQPVRNHNPWMLLYFISFLLLVSFFVLNMFVGVVVENFHKCRQHQEAEETRLREEKRLRRAEKRRRNGKDAGGRRAKQGAHKNPKEAQQKPYYADYSRTRMLVHGACTSSYLDLFITVVIGLNVVTMAMEHYDQPRSLEEALKYCNYFFTTVFVLEAAFKLVAFGIRRYFKDRWNQLDLGIVLLSIMGITLEEIEMNASLPINPTIMRIMRVLRIARVLKLLKTATGMRSLIDTVVQALPQVGNLGLLFLLLFFIYAALGVELFGRLICDDETPCEGLTRHATFENFGMAFLTLFRVSTGDNWNGIMKDTLRECGAGLPAEPPACVAHLPLISPVYFVTFVLTAQFVLVNVVVAVLMKHLEESNQDDDDDDVDGDTTEGEGGPLGPERDLRRETPSPTPRGTGSRSPRRHSADTGWSQWGQGAEGERVSLGGSPSWRPGTRLRFSSDLSLVMVDAVDAELLLMDNLSGSVCRSYGLSSTSGPPGSPKIPLAEMEALSVTSDLSERSWSPEPQRRCSAPSPPSSSSSPSASSPPPAPSPLLPRGPTRRPLNAGETPVARGGDLVPVANAEQGESRPASHGDSHRRTRHGAPGAPCPATATGPPTFSVSEPSPEGACPPRPSERPDPMVTCRSSFHRQEAAETGSQENVGMRSLSSYLWGRGSRQPTSRDPTAPPSLPPRHCCLPLRVRAGRAAVGPTGPRGTRPGPAEAAAADMEPGEEEDGGAVRAGTRGSYGRRGAAVGGSEERERHGGPRARGHLRSGATEQTVGPGSDPPCLSAPRRPR
ncbi:voltage-dependent T-type calcium channel subunit alpha-1I-like isoform X1 [Petromyzon marinus]|uniref:voltage-dependent T-type calcium channel subunit alpha-1I-like isoform X1 n=1 Tax=Petromyzon marinus TaxID=7757 RepID=UPI003F6EAE57